MELIISRFWAGIRRSKQTVSLQTASQREDAGYITSSFVVRAPFFTLRLGNDSNKLKAYSPSHPCQWFMNFSSEAQTRGGCDLIFYWVDKLDKPAPYLT